MANSAIKVALGWFRILWGLGPRDHQRLFSGLRETCKAPPGGSSSSVKVAIDEDTTCDKDRRHSREIVSVCAFSGPCVLWICLMHDNLCMKLEALANPGQVLNVRKKKCNTLSAMWIYWKGRMFIFGFARAFTDIVWSEALRSAAPGFNPFRRHGLSDCWKIPASDWQGTAFSRLKAAPLVRPCLVCGHSALSA